MKIDALFEKSDLIPAVVQDARTLQVLMVGFVNREAAALTLTTKTAWFWSRSRSELWNKGATSGNVLHIARVLTDCDSDCLLYLCSPTGPTCHTGAVSCFYQDVTEEWL